MVTFAFTLQANGLTKAQEKKLHSPAIKLLADNTYVIEFYNSINLKKTISFGHEKVNKIIVKSYSKMKKGTINKEVFNSISSSVSDQIMGRVFMTKKHIKDIKSVDLLTYTPKHVNFTIELDFGKKGIHVIMGDKIKKEKHFLPYYTLFHSEVNQ
jgi:hypothetical protein